MHPIAKCQNPECGSIFNAPSMFMGNSRATTFVNVVVDCPKCGGPAGVLDGTFDFIDNTIHLLSGPKSTIDILTKLAQTIRDSVAAGESPDKTVERITEIAPWLSSLKNLAKNQVVNLVWCALSAVAGVAVSKAWDAQSADATREQQVQVIQEGLRRDRSEQEWREFHERMKDPLPETPPARDPQRFGFYPDRGPLIREAPHTMAKLSQYMKQNAQGHK